MRVWNLKDERNRIVSQYEMPHEDGWYSSLLGIARDILQREQHHSSLFYEVSLSEPAEQIVIRAGEEVLQPLRELLVFWNSIRRYRPQRWLYHELLRLVCERIGWRHVLAPLLQETISRCQPYLGAAIPTGWRGQPLRSGLYTLLQAAQDLSDPDYGYRTMDNMGIPPIYAYSLLGRSTVVLDSMAPCEPLPIEQEPFYQFYFSDRPAMLTMGYRTQVVWSVRSETQRFERRISQYRLPSPSRLVLCLFALARFSEPRSGSASVRRQLAETALRALWLLHPHTQRLLAQLPGSLRPYPLAHSLLFARYLYRRYHSQLMRIEQGSPQSLTPLPKPLSWALQILLRRWIEHQGNIPVDEISDLIREAQAVYESVGFVEQRCSIPIESA